MFQAIRNVIFAFAGVCCALMGLFWLWFMYEFSLKWLDANGHIEPGAGATVVFGQAGAEWIGIVAAGWFVLAVIFGILQWRVSRNHNP